MKVLVIGGGGRCHAIVDALHRSPKVDKIYCAPGNAGIARLAELVPLKDTDVNGLLDFARANAIDLTVVGPEAALQAGIVDLFRGHGLRIFGPTAAAARIETSKEFAKEIASRVNPEEILGEFLVLSKFGENRSAWLCPIFKDTPIGQIESLQKQHVFHLNAMDGDERKSYYLLSKKYKTILDYDKLNNRK